MLTNSPLHASFAVNDIPAAQKFYSGTLGVRVVEIDEGLLSIQASNGYSVLAFEQYPSGPIKTNEKGIAHPGPWQAWFRDPAGNILSVTRD